MKQFIKSILPGAALVFTMGMTSCVGDLDVKSIDPNTDPSVNAPALFNKLYANMAVAGNGGANGDCDIDGLDGGTTGFVRQLFNANELTTDESICCWGDEGIPAFNYNQYDASHPMLKGFYYRLFTGITYCNQYLTECSAYDKTMTAEARFLRALYYYYLLDCWGNVPIVTTISNDLPAQNKRAEVFAFIERELKEIHDDMLAPEARNSSNKNYGRADQDACDLLLARLYLNAEVYTGKAMWSEAMKLAEAVMTGKHTLNTTSIGGWSAYQMLFMADNGETCASTEAILPLLQDGVKTTSWGTTLFLLASTVKNDMSAIDGGTFGSTEGWAGNRCRPEFVAKFFPDGNAPNGTVADMVQAAGDQRALLWGKDRTLSVDKVGEFTSGFSVAKFNNRTTTGGSGKDAKYVDTDFFLMRSAEAYLIFAECDARLNHDKVTIAGKKAIDDLRKRAGAYVSDTQYYTTEDILDERARELYYEGFRRTDLIRYGQYGGNTTYRWQYKGGSKNGVNFSADLNLFAIPASEIESNRLMDQNDGYK